MCVFFQLHFIFQHKNPKTGKFEEKHAKKTTSDLKGPYTDKGFHLYTLVVNPDNSFKIYIDQKEVNSGSLLEDMTYDLYCFWFSLAYWNLLISVARAKRILCEDVTADWTIIARGSKLTFFGPQLILSTGVIASSVLNQVVISGI